MLVIFIALEGCDFTLEPRPRDNPLDSGSDVFVQPQIVSVIPGDGASGINPAQEISLVFNKDMDPLTFNVSSCFLQNLSSGESLSGSYNYYPENYEMIFTPPGGLKWYTAYRLTVANTIADSGGNLLSEGVEVSFDTFPSGWSSRTLDSGTSVFYGVSMDADNNGAVYISYLDWDNYKLKYITNATASWVARTIDAVSGDREGYGSDIAVDGSGKVHLSYYNYTTGEIKYATNSSGIWESESVAAVKTGDSSQYTALEVDASGDIHLAYYDSVDLDLEYAWKSSGSWTYYSIDTTGDVGTYIDMSMAPGATVSHICYIDATNGKIKYVSGSGTGWIMETIASQAPDYGFGHIAIAAGSGESVYIAYFDNTNHGLQLASFTGGIWAGELIDGPYSGYVYAGIGPDMDLDSNGNIHIYYSFINDEIFSYQERYATNASGEWDIVTLSPSANWRGIALDGNNMVHMGYITFSNALGYRNSQ